MVSTTLDSFRLPANRCTSASRKKTAALLATENNRDSPSPDHDENRAAQERRKESRSKPSSKNTRNPSGSLHINSPDSYLDELFASMNDGEHEDDGDDDEPEITEEQIYGSQEFYANINRLSPSGEGDDGDDGPAVGSDDGIEGQLKGYKDDQQDEGEGEGEGENGGGNDGAPKRKRKIVKEGKG
ncbi:hypothetical protein SCLCIDRAFT_29664 [Scleroderma citrinum Foug A]|uniref:Uncharacterized protein n=1 Tax=Scleroderma citrinum Foug A TaxID=1036808 RepID=A0A0C2Z335_9AGAM|nr:hypothetical protein SCLCIDRAFT_29664 [Scleroderma citrinum Foug A]